MSSDSNTKLKLATTIACCRKIAYLPMLSCFKHVLEHPEDLQLTVLRPGIEGGAHAGRSENTNRFLKMLALGVFFMTICENYLRNFYHQETNNFVEEHGNNFILTFPYKTTSFIDESLLNLQSDPIAKSLHITGSKNSNGYLEVTVPKDVISEDNILSELANFNSITKDVESHQDKHKEFVFGLSTYTLNTGVAAAATAAVLSSEDNRNYLQSAYENPTDAVTALGKRVIKGDIPVPTNKFGTGVGVLAVATLYDGFHNTLANGLNMVTPLTKAHKQANADLRESANRLHQIIRMKNHIKVTKDASNLGFSYMAVAAALHNMVNSDPDMRFNPYEKRLHTREEPPSFSHLINSEPEVDEHDKTIDKGVDERLRKLIEAESNSKKSHILSEIVSGTSGVTQSLVEMVAHALKEVIIEFFRVAFGSHPIFTAGVVLFLLFLIVNNVLPIVFVIKRGVNVVKEYQENLISWYTANKDAIMSLFKAANVNNGQDIPKVEAEVGDIVRKRLEDIVRKSKDEKEKTEGGKSRRHRNKRTKNRKQNKRMTKRVGRGRYTRR